MITSLRLVDFKNFADETLRVGPFTVIVGANASGKSNLRDAFRFLHGIGRGYTLAEIIGGKYGAGGQVEWVPIRGAASEVIRFGQSGFSLRVRLKLGRARVRYSIRAEYDEDSRSGFRVTKERFRVGPRYIYRSHPEAPDPVRAQDDDAHLLLRYGEDRRTEKVRPSDRSQAGSAGPHANQGTQERRPNSQGIRPVGD